MFSPIKMSLKAIPNVLALSIDPILVDSVIYLYVELCYKILH